MTSSISVVIPAYNEEKRLPPSLERVASYLASFEDLDAEILIVDDGSSDDTPGLVRRMASELSRPGLAIRLLENPGNRGKGYSVRHGMLEASKDWVLFTDADLSAPIEESERLLRVAEGGGMDGAIGSRALDRSLIGTRQPLFREYSGRFFNFCVRLGAGLSFRDTQCGFKLFSRKAAREIFKRQRMERFGFDVEILYLARKLGYRIAEVPVRWNDVEGTKVTTLDGANAFLDIARVRWNALRGLYR